MAGIEDADDKSAWNGIIIQGNEGYVYGNATTIGYVNIDEGVTLTVLENSTLTTGSFSFYNYGTINVSENSTLITDSITFDNFGTLSNHGKIITKGSFYNQYNSIIENYNEIEIKGDFSNNSESSKIILHDGKINSTEDSWFVNSGIISGNGELTGTKPSNGGIILLNKEFTSSTYIDAAGQTHTCNEVVELTEDMTGLTEGWYVVTGNITISERFKTDGDVHIILADGAHLNAEKGIDVNNNASLTIYAQSDDESTMGQLTATGEDYSVGIGSDGMMSMDMGNITINGGKITATGGENSIGIGGMGGSEDGGNITINGGVVEATGKGWGSGIGGNNNNISITGGTVTATSDTGAGIGGNVWDDNKIISITGGTVTATSNTGAGIGGNSGDNVKIGKINIDGGTVTSTSTDGAGIGVGSGTNCTSGAITINGGTITATSTNYDGIGGNGSGTFAATGNAVVIANGGTGANAITDADDTSAWNGIIIQGSAGQVYGDVTTTGDVTIPSGNTTTIPSDITLKIGSDATLTNEGTLTNLGNVVIEGTLNNKGTINNSANVTITNNGELNIETGGKVTNNGTLKNEGNLNNAGELENNGTCNSTNGTITGAGTISGSQPVTPGRNVVCGDFTVSGGTLGTDYNFENGVLTVLTDTALTIKNTTPGTATTNRIEIDKDVSANVTLAGVNIDASGQIGAAAFKIKDNSTGNVTITLAGDNVLKSASNCAGLQKNGVSGHLEIKGSGELKAYGGSSGAGIGGGRDKASGNITISSGTVTANGGTGHYVDSGGAGIGGGQGGAGSNITISGGTVTAKGGVNSAGIGGGYGSTGSTGNQITGGLVTAHGDGGQSIQGSNITLPAGNQEVVIMGAGHQLDIATDTIYGSGQSIKVLSGGTLNVADGVTLTDYCAIDNQGTINIAGTLKLGSDASLNNKSGGKVNMSNGMIDNSSTGSISNNGDITGTGTIIGHVSGTPPTSGITLTPSSTLSDFTVTGGTEGVDYVFDSEFDTLLIKTDTALTIKNKDTTIATTNSIRIEGDVNANVTLAGVNIASPYAAFDVWSGDNCQVTVTLAAGSKNVLKSDYGAGLNKAGSGNLEIKGTGELTAIGGVGCAGIGGGGMDRDSGNITISDGTITAIGGEGGAGIGGGIDGSGSNITISGGTVTAQGGADAAGIGGGKKDWESSTASGSNNQITGGVVTAIGNGAKNAVEGGNVTSAESASKATIVGTGAQLDVTTMTIANGEVVEVLSGGALNVASGVTLTDNGTLNNAGTITLNGTIHVDADGGAAFDNSGSITGTGEITGKVPTGSGTIADTITYPGAPVHTSAQYLDATGQLQTCADVTKITSADQLTGPLANGWYVVEGTVDLGSQQLVIGGSGVHLILADGATLKTESSTEGGIDVQAGNKLTIYAQSTGDNMGKIIAKSGSNHAGIGGGFTENVGEIVINGGDITATGTDWAAGIGAGGGGGQNCRTITINGGNVTANGSTDNGSNAAGIGGGNNSQNGNVTINGGIVETTGGSSGIKGTFSTGTNGHAVIISKGGVSASAGCDAIIIDSTTNKGQVYGDVTTKQDVTFDSGTTITIGSGSSLTVGAGTTLTNNGTVENSGALEIAPNGKLVNNGSVINKTGGTLTNGGTTTVESGGTVTNEAGGAVTNTDTGKLDVENGGKVDNKGDLNNQGNTTVAGEVANTGNVNNSGTTTVESGGKVNNETAGTVTNTGTGKLDVEAGGKVDNKGDLNNQGDPP